MLLIIFVVDLQDIFKRKKKDFVFNQRSFIHTHAHAHIGSNSKSFCFTTTYKKTRIFFFNEITCLASRIYSYEEVRSAVAVLAAGKSL